MLTETLPTRDRSAEAAQEARLDRSPTTSPTTDHQPTTWPEHREAPGGPMSRGVQTRGGDPATMGGSSPRRLGRAIRRLVPSTGPVIGSEPALSTGGGFRSANRPEPPVRNGPSMPVRGGGPPAGGGTGGSGGGPRMPRGGNPGPRPERYWTDYLRIALPIIGLILMLSVFIFWVGSIIDGNNDNGGVTPTGEVALSTTTPVPGAAGNVTATVPPAQSVAPSNADGGAGASASEPASDQPATEPTAPPDQTASAAPNDQPTNQPATDAAATETPASGGATFAVDDTVVTTQSVNLRSEASNADDGTILRTLDAGAELTIIGEPENDGEFDWYPVSDADGKGYVREDFLEAA